MHTKCTYSTNLSYKLLIRSYLITGMLTFLYYINSFLNNAPYHTTVITVKFFENGSSTI